MACRCAGVFGQPRSASRQPLRGLALLTRDASHYRTYFLTVEFIAPGDRRYAVKRPWRMLGQPDLGAAPGFDRDRYKFRRTAEVTFSRLTGSRRVAT